MIKWKGRQPSRIEAAQLIYQAIRSCVDDPVRVESEFVAPGGWGDFRTVIDDLKSPCLFHLFVEMRLFLRYSKTFDDARLMASNIALRELKPCLEKGGLGREVTTAWSSASACSAVIFVARKKRGAAT